MQTKSRVIIAVTFTAALIAAAVSLFVVFEFFFYPVKYKREIYSAANEYSVPADLIISIVRSESGFDKDAVSPRGAAGLMQLMPSTAEWAAKQIKTEYSEDLLTDPDYNIRLGTWYYKYLSDKFEDERLALIAYNAGEGVLSEWLERFNGKDFEIPYKETREYVTRVEKARRHYKGRV